MLAEYSGDAFASVRCITCDCQRITAIKCHRALTRGHISEMTALSLNAVCGIPLVAVR